MPFRLYLIPAIGTGTSSDPRVPKYISALDASWGAMDYGFQPLFLAAADLSVDDDAAVVANADVTAFPFDLNPAIGGGQALNNARNALEAALIPAQWVAASSTWREVARTVAGMFQYMQRLNFYLGNEVLIDTSAKLNVQWSAIPVNPYQTAILTAASSLGYTFNPQPNDQLRKILKDLSDQWGTKTFLIGQFSF